MKSKVLTQVAEPDSRLSSNLDEDPGMPQQATDSKKRHKSSKHKKSKKSKKRHHHDNDKSKKTEADRETSKQGGDYDDNDSLNLDEVEGLEASNLLTKTEDDAKPKMSQNIIKGKDEQREYQMEQSKIAIVEASNKNCVEEDPSNEKKRIQKEVIKSEKKGTK